MGSALATLGASGRLVAPIVEDILKIMGGTHLLMIACTKSRNAPKKRTPPPHVIRQLLRPDDIARLFDYVRQLHFGAVIAVADEDEGWLRYSESHEVRYLHHGGEMHDGEWRTLQEACPALFADLLQRVRRAAHFVHLADVTEVLRVRCIEFHTYTEGGELTDETHTDAGSRLTLSVLLTDPADLDGGCFTTTDHRGRVTKHDLARGDAVLLDSEMVHNVTRVESGERRSLVLELWTGRENRKDRFQ